MSLRRSQPGSHAGVAVAAGGRRSRYLAVIGVLFGGLLLASSASVWTLYRSVRGEMDRLLGERLVSIATTVAETLGPMRFAELAVLGPDSGDWSEALAELRRIALLNELDNLVVLDADLRTVIDVRGEIPFGEIHPLFAVQPELRTTLVSGVARTTPLEPVAVEGAPQQYLKTGFAPVLDTGGVVLGAVAVEGGSGFFTVLSQLRRAAWVSLASGAAALLVLGWLFYRALRSLMRLEDSMRSAAALAAIGQISAVVAHEIKNPLAILRSRSERVRSKIEKGKDPAEVLQWFEAIPREVDRLNDIVTNYLSLARPEQAGAEGSSAGDVIEETVGLMRGELEKRGIPVELDLEREPGFTLPLGPRSLKQIVLNLVLNASQAIEETGRIAIRTRLDGRARVLAVTDDGRGMTREELTQIRQPFFTTKATGSGLGLTLVSSLVEARGGRLEIESTPNRGTTVTIRFPE